PACRPPRPGSSLRLAPRHAPRGGLLRAAQPQGDPVQLVGVLERLLLEVDAIARLRRPFGGGRRLRLIGRRIGHESHAISNQQHPKRSTSLTPAYSPRQVLVT